MKRETAILSNEKILPSCKEIFLMQGIPEKVTPGKHIVKLFNTAMEIFSGLSRPRSTRKEVTENEFDKIFSGNGQNEQGNPPGIIYKNATSLSLFAVTTGSELSEKISKLANELEFPLSSMLDSVASAATEKLVTVTAENFIDSLANECLATTADSVLPYSPGYCGWHISGQKALFDSLQPEEIGITLNESYLMTPLKSISGVLVCGPGKIHAYRENLEFCARCKNKTCRDRTGIQSNKYPAISKGVK